MPGWIPISSPGEAGVRVYEQPDEPSNAPIASFWFVVSGLTMRVLNGADPVPNVAFRVSDNSHDGTQVLTNSSGIAELFIDDTDYRWL